MRRITVRLLVATASTAVCLVAAEGLYRWLRSEEVTEQNLHVRYRMYYRDADRQEIDLGQAAARGLVEPVPFSPRPRWHYAPGLTFYQCYTGLEQAWFDEQGCVECRINSMGVRDREELCEPKVAGERRVVCLGDSFTFGWGVPVEEAWPRRVERDLRTTDDGLRLVNCGASYGLYLDEQRAALEHHFHRFEPDAVVVTVCLNDLIPTSLTLGHAEPRPLPFLLRHSRMLRDLLHRGALEEALRIDPDRDLVAELLALPPELYPQWTQNDNVGPDDLWPGGGPQRALLGMRDWCRERSLPFGVVLWPLFQGLGRGEHYPFAKMHALVAEFSAEHGIPFLDVRGELEGAVDETPELWVSPADPHGSVLAHELATPAIAAFVGDLLGLER